MSATLIGLGASLLTLFIGMTFTELNAGQILITIGCANVANLLTLLTVLGAEQRPAIKRFINSTPKIWVLFWFLFHAQIWLWCEWMRNVMVTLVLWLPLFFSGSFAALLFGPVQDRVMWARQRRNHSS